MCGAMSLLAFVLGFLACLASLPGLLMRMRVRGMVGPDVHKGNRPAVPEMGGIGILVGLTVSMVAMSVLSGEAAPSLLCLLTVVLATGVVGALDDLRPMNPIVKPALTALAGLPILILGLFYADVYVPRPVLPFIGPTHLTLVYPLMIPVTVAVFANAVNMMDSFNGQMAGTSSIVVLVQLASAVVLGRSSAALMCAGLLGCLLAFFYFNRHPAKTFAGDVGSLSVGAAIGATAIIGRLEVVTLVAFMPQIMNAFYGLATIGRLYERREVPRPTRLLEDGRLEATDDPKAPITLARMVLARGPLPERDIVRVFIALQAISGVLALFTLYLVVAAT